MQFYFMILSPENRSLIWQSNNINFAGIKVSN
jgi:hypothetical protein